jgi:hypothetical protein
LPQAVEQGAPRPGTGRPGRRPRHAFMRYTANGNAQNLEEALDAAVEAGALTQEQADLLREAQGAWEEASLLDGECTGGACAGRGMGGDRMEGWGDHGGFHPHGRMPGAPTATPEANIVADARQAVSSSARARWACRVILHAQLFYQRRCTQYYCRICIVFAGTVGRGTGSTDTRRGLLAHA